MEEKVYEIELTEEELEIIFVALHPRKPKVLASDIIDYGLINNKNFASLLEKRHGLAKKIEDIVDNRKHQ